MFKIFYHHWALLVIVFALVTPAHAAANILLIGDSLSVMTAPYFPNVEVRAKNGERLAWGKQALRKADQIVWALGTNNGLFGELSPLYMRRYVNRVLLYADCVVVPTMFVQHFGKYSHDFTAVNRYLRHDRRIIVADWATWMWTHPEHRGDGVHPDEKGIQARVVLINKALSQCTAKF